MLRAFLPGQIVMSRSFKDSSKANLRRSLPKQVRRHSRHTSSMREPEMPVIKRVPR